MQAVDLPAGIRVWQLVKLGVSLTEQGYDEPPAVLLDELLGIDATFNRWLNRKREQ